MAEGTAALLDRILTHIRARVDPDYAFLSPGPSPWTRPPSRSEDLRPALVTTGGIHLRSDPPFRALDMRWGDTSHRMIPHGTPSRLLALDAPYVDQKYTPADVEVALPMAALGELHREGHIGAPAPNHASFCGGILRPLPGLADSVESLHRALRDDGTTGVILLPTCSICVQTTCILARELEKRGMPTVAISLLPELSAIVGAPRTLVVRFPFGAPAGDPGNGDLHRAVLSEAIDLLLEAKAAGEVRTSALAWRR